MVNFLPPPEGEKKSIPPPVLEHFSPHSAKRLLKIGMSISHGHLLDPLHLHLKLLIGCQRTWSSTRLVHSPRCSQWSTSANASKVTKAFSWKPLDEWILHSKLVQRAGVTTVKPMARAASRPFRCVWWSTSGIPNWTQFSVVPARRHMAESRPNA